ncbi:MAG: homoserine O-acetyltransferase [Muribaculaceae bacterium]|nr:homoserine O-acetyltransferase [Muribaculaceae bacterium]MDE6295255.1 homoserine O-acetyltransferase [Muribaculaceae bacterium]
MRYFVSDTEFPLECSGSLPGITVAYHTFGHLNEDKSNVIWVMHALTANSDVADWWPHTVEKGKFLDPDKYFIVCANVIGSCYGSTGPCTPLNDGTPPLYGDFPGLTVRDMVEAHRLLARHLGITRIDTIIGSSLGGFQALEWLVTDPEIARRAVLCATDFQCRPWLAAINKAMYMAIGADNDLGRKSPDAARKGLEAARAIALLSYRSHSAYDMTQADDMTAQTDPFKRRVHSYQAYQGQKLADRFDVYSYLTLCRSSDTHNVARGRGDFKQALGRIKAKCLVTAISSDILFPPQYHREMADMIPDAEYHVIDSEFAHDGFLIEHERLDSLIQDFYKRTDNNKIE